jgi:hypothetical protein
VRKIPAVLAVLSLAAVGLAGCALLPGSSECTRSAAADPEVAELVTVSGELGAEPTVDVRTPFHVDDIAFADPVTGEGTPIISEAQLVEADVTLISGETGELMVSTVNDPPLVLPVSRWAEIFPPVFDALDCAAEGSRVVVALPPGGVEAQVAESSGLADDESSIAVIDLHKVYLSKADGSNVYNTGHGLPTVVRAADGRPGIIVPDGEPPTEVTVQTIKKGDGPVVTGDEPARVHYTGVTWDERTVFDSTWDSEPASLTLDAVVPGFAQALEGQTVGSQVMVVVPPDAGYGDTAQGEIPANSTLVFVIDILGLDEVASQ